MRYSIFITLVLFWGQGLSQPSYDSTLLLRLEQIEKLTTYNNTVVISIDSIDYCPDACFPYWKPSITFYEDDICRYKYCQYRAIKDSVRGIRPDTAGAIWKLIKGPSPYLFLRDTAKTEDLQKLLLNEHPYIRTYAFAALSYRKFDNLFPVLVANLKDTTKINQFTFDVEDSSCPADLMLSYAIEDFDSSHKDVIRKLILTKYSHLNTLEEILLFHKPIPEDYRYIRQIAQGETFGKSRIIALSRYKKQADVELIRKWLKEDGYYSGYRVIFMAAENFPDATFKKDLIEYKTKIKMDYDMSGHKYYFNSLAAYKDKDCLSVLEEFVNQPTDNDNPYKKANYRNRNLSLIHQALKKYHVKMFNALEKRIETLTSNTKSEELFESDVEKSPWNY
jgi:hypothetical protein